MMLQLRQLTMVLPYIVVAIIAIIAIVAIVAIEAIEAIEAIIEGTAVRAAELILVTVIVTELIVITIAIGLRELAVSRCCSAYSRNTQLRRQELLLEP